GLTDANSARVVTLPPALFASVSPVQQPSGIVAIAAPRRRDPADVLAGDRPLVLLLDAVQDPGNVGAIVRVAEGCGASGVIAGPGTADPFGWKALRGAMGSTFRLPVAAAASLTDALRSVRAAGLRVVATVPRGGTPLRQTDLVQPAAILLGGEGAGIPADVIGEADEQVTIPMRPPVESLNVAIAAALVLYEARRQRDDVAV
ncbi:MAG TPA: RNA methyltransferase, partial [Vicinamibacterales bacterium]|nr:RNA methyltransferase [Vicinamibacterales bacterium]